MLVNAVKSAIILLCALLLSSCLDLMGTLKSDESEEIQTPSSADVSPKMDFNKIHAVAVFPLFPGGGPTVMGHRAAQYIQDPAYGEEVAQGLSSELAAKQSQWKVHSYRDVTDAIARHDLARGYKNFQADFNTAHGQIQAFLLTAESKQFLVKLANVMKVDAFIFGSYDLSYQMQPVQTYLGTLANKKVYHSGVSSVLYYARNQEIWWKASHRLTGSDRAKIVSVASKSLASYVGKGTLRQL